MAGGRTIRDDDCGAQPQATRLQADGRTSARILMSLTAAFTVRLGCHSKAALWASAQFGTPCCCAKEGNVCVHVCARAHRGATPTGTRSARGPMCTKAKPVKRKQRVAQVGWPSCRSIRSRHSLLALCRSKECAFTTEYRCKSVNPTACGRPAEPVRVRAAPSRRFRAARRRSHGRR
jgi:hypothetical protein